MARFVLHGSILREILIVAAFLLASACVQPPVALAQHGGGHIGGSGHFGSGGRMVAPHVFAPQSSHATISRPRVLVGPPLAGVGVPSFRFRLRPVQPLQPVFPVFRPPVLFGAPFFRCGVGLRFNSFWWPTCGPFWGWGFSCNTLPFYGYGFGNYFSPQAYEYPVYLYGGEGRELPQLYLKDGTVYNVTDYWLVNGLIHFTMVEEGGTKSVEHVLGFDELDLQRTIDVNTQRGFRFMLRNEPVEQYLRDHPNLAPPAGPLPQEK